MNGYVKSRGGDERFLDRPRADPTNQIQHRAGLVVGAGPARAAERLLPDDGAGRLVVDVEVPRGIPERAHRFAHRDAVAAEHRAGQRVGRCAIDDIERFLPFLVRIDVSGDDRSEDLFAQTAVAGIGGFDQRRLDEITRASPVAVPPDRIRALRFASSR